LRDIVGLYFSIFGNVVTDLNSLLIFAKVVEANSFSEAARRLGLPVSTVSRRVAELEDELGVRLLERSTRCLRLTELGLEVYEHAQRTTEISEAVNDIVSNQQTDVTGILRLSTPPSISDSLIAPLVGAFQASYPNVRVQIFVTERYVDLISEGVDVAFRLGELKDSNLVARKVLTYRHQLVACPHYLKQIKPLKCPQDLLEHKLLAFGSHQGTSSWELFHVDGNDKQTVTFQPYVSINDFFGLSSLLISGGGIGVLPPIVQPELVREGRLVEVMPDWRFKTLNLSIVYLGNRHMSRPLRVFKEFATEMLPVLFPNLPV
jgi:DNA-binding transcriptional LysR family regulator